MKPMTARRVRADRAARVLLCIAAAWVLTAFPAAFALAQSAGGQAPAPPAQVEEPTEPAPENPTLPPEGEMLAQRIFNELISPCCWTTTVAQHGSGAAPRIQAEVRRMIAGGMGYTEIMDHYVRQYGERILAKPEKKGFNLAVYLVPYLAIAAGAGAIVAVFRKRAPRKAVSPAQAKAARAAGGGGPADPRPDPGSQEDYRRRIEEEIRRTS